MNDIYDPLQISRKQSIIKIAATVPKIRPQHRRNKSEMILMNDTFYWVEGTRCHFLDFIIKLLGNFEIYVCKHRC